MPNGKKNGHIKAPYFNRELSWLAFNRRVLEQAYDPRYPLLERLRFMSFVSSNLDEFYEIRVAGLLQQLDSNVAGVGLGLDGLGPKEQLRRVHNVAGALVKDQYKCWHEILVPELAGKSIHFKTSEELTQREIGWLKKYFEDQVFPVLTPLANDPSHPFPQFGNKTLNILLSLDDPSTEHHDNMMAFIPVPRILPRVIKIPASGKAKAAYIFLSEILKLFAHLLFPGYKLRSVHAFRITRNSDLYIDEEEVENLLQTIEENLHKMRRGAAVRLEIEAGVNDELLNRLLTSINLSREFVFHISGPLNLMRLIYVNDLIDRPDLKFKPLVPYCPPTLSEAKHLFENIRREDQLLHHPYESFTPVVDFIKEAARDPNVLAIKLTLYRTSSDSPIVGALCEAARMNKQVTVLIELKARFDEAQNIQWARQLEDSGVHVVYGFVGLKTHCKCMLVVRREGKELRRYAHLGTGNYHPKTARLYTDLSYFTAREEITEEVAMVFNALTGFAKAPEFKKLLVAPFNLHTAFKRMIQREARNARDGKPARIIVKCNSLIDQETIDSLYSASQAGVKIDLIIRGICGLVPGVKGLSENIRVRSILGRFLEHSRIFYFENAAGQPDLYIGSADWMPRNFYRRVEVVVPIADERLRHRIIHEILGSHLKDNGTATLLKPTGGYSRVTRGKNEPEFTAQDFFMAEADRLRLLAEVPNEGTSMSDPKIG
ncbi:MAG: polyphosphate kinase 1 [Verrucomicrobiota bacterium]|nr:polyphosphate kinase 1 [Verrucomicrobiota bacterium]